MSKRIRIKDIAERAGVSVGTVDRVIHRRGNVSKKAEQKVLRVMKELNYKPNIIASTLAYNRTFRIATLLPDYEKDPYWEHPKNGVERAISSVQHYNIVWDPSYFHIDDPDDFLLKGKEMLKSRPDAVLVAPVFLEEAVWLLNRCRQLKIPTVKINTNIEEGHSLCYVGQNSYQSGVLAGKLLKFFLQKSDVVMVLNLDKKATAAQHLIDKEQGIRDYLTGIFGNGVKVVKYDFSAYDDPDKLRGFMSGTLEQHPRLRGVFITNSRSYKLMDCINESLLKGIQLVGFDLLEQNLNYLRKDRISFLLNQNPFLQGYRGVINLFTHLVLRKKVDKVQYLPLDIVVTENADYYLKRQEEPQVMV